MTQNTSPRSDAREEPDAPAGISAPVDAVEPARFTLASLLDLNADELAEPLPRTAPPEHRWEQLSLGVTADTGDAIPTEMRTGAASQPPTHETELIPGLDQPGAVEIPVYLAGKALHDLMHRTPATPIRPPAISIAAVGPPRKKMDPPAANFSKADQVPVLWPKRRKSATPAVSPKECARCSATVEGERCSSCGHGVAVSARARQAGVWNDTVAAFLESDSRVVRTLGALVITPGELTRAFVSGQRRPYLPPWVLGVFAAIVFTAISAVGNLRPRPDRSLTIGIERTREMVAGLADAAPVNLAVQPPPDLLRDVAVTLADLPFLWLPLMAFGVVAVVAAGRTFAGREDHGEFVFAAHFASWFVLWWGVAVPLVLLTVRFGLEYSAAAADVTRVLYLDDGRIDGLSAGWNAVHSTMSTAGAHTVLLAIGLMPWAVLAYRRAFDASWLRALLTGAVIGAVPVVLLIPFA